MTILAILAGILTFFNYFWRVNGSLTASLSTVSLIGQFVLVVVTVIALLGYRGVRSRPSYDGGYYKIWNLRFGIIVVSFIAALAVLVVFLLQTFGVISEL